MQYLFYCFEGQYKSYERSLYENYTFFLWKPTFSQLMPPKIPFIPFAVWWGMHYSHIFANKNYSLFVIYDGNTLIHRSGIFPRYFRFPFMDKGDLQIGDTWTAPEYQGKGLATFAVEQIVKLFTPGRKLWYVVEEINIPSIRVVEKVGFVRKGQGEKVNRLGIPLLGAYIIIQNQ